MQHIDNFTIHSVEDSKAYRKATNPPEWFPLLVELLDMGASFRSDAVDKQ